MMIFKQENVKLVVKDQEVILEINNQPVFSTDRLKTLFSVAGVIIGFGEFLDKEKLKEKELLKKEEADEANLLKKSWKKKQAPRES